jgi:hypothetical protein
MTSNEDSRTILRILPERGWREVWHDAPCRGPMRRLSESLVFPEMGVSLPLWECLGCDAKMYAGIDKDRRIVVRPYGEKGDIG